jgi:hypothetical protein
MTPEEVTHRRILAAAADAADAATMLMRCAVMPAHEHRSQLLGLARMTSMNAAATIEAIFAPPPTATTKQEQPDGQATPPPGDASPQLTLDLGAAPAASDGSGDHGPVGAAREPGA